MGRRRRVASSPDWATGVIRVAVASGAGCGSPEPAVLLTTVVTRRPPGLGRRRWVASSSDWATGVFRVAVAPGQVAARLRPRPC